MYLDVFKI